MSETVSISTLDGAGRFDCYVARPAGAPRAAVVVIQEIFGVNAGIRRTCDRLAADGYLDPAIVDRRWQDHLSGRRDSTSALWAVLMFQAWRRDQTMQPGGPA